MLFRSRFLDASIKGAIGGSVFGLPGGIAQARHERNVALHEQQRRAAEFGEMAQPEATGIAQLLPQPPTQPVLPTQPAPQAAPPVQSAPQATPPTPPAPPAPAVPATEAWNVKMVQETLAMQLAKPEALQNKELIAALRADLARRGVPETQGAQNVPKIGRAHV